MKEKIAYTVIGLIAAYVIVVSLVFHNTTVVEILDNNVGDEYVEIEMVVEDNLIKKHINLSVHQRDIMKIGKRYYVYSDILEEGVAHDTVYVNHTEMVFND